MFDRAEITVKAGDGGNGVVSFRREKFVPFGGPDGGDGGDGGDVVITAERSASSLKAFWRRRHFKAANGKNGRGKDRHGKKGESLTLVVPVGTMVSHKSQIGGDSLIADLDQPGQSVIVAKGGKGGRGNARFATSTNQAPQTAEEGTEGEEHSLILELKLIADVGVIGYPNVGKSTLLAAVSAAKPRIASYPFTTLEPVLGMVEVGRQSFVLAEIPGLIAGAHLGKGLGHDFLRHIMRTRVLIHLLDGGSPTPAEDMAQVNTELSLFDSALARKPQLVAINKIDLAQVKARREELEESFRAIGTEVFFISAVSGQGIPELMAAVAKIVQSAPKLEPAKRKKVFRPQPKR
jgi:GTP-binding protein